MKTLKYSFLLICFVFSIQLLGQKKIKDFSIPEVKKGDISSKAFKDYPNSQSRILFDLGKVYFHHDVDTFRLERSRHLRVKILSDTTLSAHELGLTSFDHQELENLIHYSLKNGDLSTDDITSIWKDINNYTPLKPQLQSFRSGDILEFKFSEDLESIENIPGWQFEYEIPVDYSEWNANVPALFKYRPIFKGYVPFYINSSELLKDENKTWVEIDGFFVQQYRYACKEVPPFQTVVYSPSSKNYLTAVDFYLEEVKKYKGYSSMMGQSWEQVSNQLFNDEKLGRRIIEFNAASFIEKMNLDTSVEHQIIDVYNWVKNTIKWNGEIGIYAENSLDEVLKNKVGSISEINLLLSALLQELKIPVSPVLLRTNDQGEVNMELPSPSQFNYVITWIDFNGNHLLLDASDPCLEIDLLRPACLNSKGLKVTSRFEEWAELENGLAAKITIITRSVVDDDELVASVNISKTHQFAFNDCRKNDDVYELVDIEEGISLFDVEFLKRDSTLKGNTIKLKCNADSLVNKNGSSWSFMPFWFEQIKTSPFVEKERKYPIVFPFLFEYNWNFIFSYTNNVSVSNVPKRAEIAIPDNTMRFIYEVKELDGILQVNAQLSILKRRYEPTDYEDILDFYDEVYKMFNEEVKIKVKSQ